MREARLILAALGRVCPLQPQSAICYLLSVIALKARGQRRRWNCQKVTTTPTSINKITIG